MIKIRSKRELQFPISYKGIITVEIDLTQILLQEKSCVLRLICTCTKKSTFKDSRSVFDGVDENKKPIYKTVVEDIEVDDIQGSPITKFHKMSFDDVDLLSKNIGIKTSGLVMTDLLNVLKSGLLAITQIDCNNGDGDFGSNADDWFIVED